MKNIDTEISNLNSYIEALEKKLPPDHVRIKEYRNPVTLIDALKVDVGIANLKAAKSNLEASQKLIQSIEQFNKSSTKLSKWMLRLTYIIAILTFFIAVLTFEQITDKWLYRRISSYKSTSIKAHLEEEATSVPPIEESQQSKP